MVMPAADMLAFGVTAIGEVDGAFTQNVKDVQQWRQAIAQGQAEAELEVSAAANAAPATKADVNVLGTAPAAANQQNASPNFTVSVQKK